MKRTNLRYILIPALLLLGFQNLAADPPSRGIFDLWNYQEVIDIRLTFDLQEVFNDREGEAEDHAAFITFRDETGTQQNWDLKISTRGNFRRQKCNGVPPLKLNFKKGDLRQAGLADFDDFKLVTYCLEDAKVAKELLLKEYLTYRLFNQLTPISYRVQLVDITYEDVRTGEKLKQMGFLIEDTAQLRDRLGAQKVDDLRVVDPERYEPEYRKLVAMFQYMIGNADWGLTHSKNINYVVKDNQVFPIPYDFDFAALVDAPYMVPSSYHGLTSRYDRVYLGFERSHTELEPVIRRFQDKKAELYQTVENFRMLKRSEREEMIAYMDTFFQGGDEIRFSENWY